VLLPPSGLPYGGKGNLKASMLEGMGFGEGSLWRGGGRERELTTIKKRVSERKHLSGEKRPAHLEIRRNRGCEGTVLS